jgi:hypothetical protein
MKRNMLLHRRWTCLLIALLLQWASACQPAPANPAERIQARWQVDDSQGMNVPHSFFWFTMDYIEFRPDGTIWGLMGWPPGEDGDLRLNVTGEYALVGGDQIEFVGACRYEDPCTGRYTLTFQGDSLELSGAGSRLLLKQAGPPSKEAPPPPPAPAPSPTPGAGAPAQTITATRRPLCPPAPVTS